MIPLSRTEQRVADLLATGLINREIGERLNICEDTVKTHVKAILRKLGCTTRTEAAAAILRSQARADVLAPVLALIEAAPNRLDCRYAIAGIGERVLIDVEELRKAVAS